MAALVVRIYSRKKEKANRPSELKKIPLGYYIRLGPRSQESHIYLETKQLRRGKQINRNFGIKSFYPKIGGACVYTKIWEEERGNSKLPRFVSIKKSIA